MLINKINKRLAQPLDDAGQPAKHRRLAEAVLALIEEGVLAPGTRLPAETELAEGLPFSLGTIQKALRTLSELGVVDRRTRRGTVVAEKTGQIFDLWQLRFVDRTHNTVLPVFSTVTMLDRVGPGGPWSRFLAPEESYVRIEREINVDDRFRAMSYFYISGSEYGEIADRDPADLEGVHLHAVIRRDFGVSTDHTSRRVLCTTVPDTVCLRLSLPSGARGLLCQMQGYTGRSQPLSYQEVYTPADADPMEFRDVRPSV